MKRLLGSARSVAARCTRGLPAVFEFVFFFGGLMSLTAGAWMIYRPLGPIAGGLAGIWVAFLIAVERQADGR